jgi:hypothetical protein
MKISSWEKVKNWVQTMLENHPRLWGCSISNRLRGKGHEYTLEDCRKCLACSTVHNKDFTLTFRPRKFNENINDPRRHWYLYPDSDDGDAVERTVSAAILKSEWPSFVGAPRGTIKRGDHV